MNKVEPVGCPAPTSVGYDFEEPSPFRWHAVSTTSPISASDPWSP